MTLSPRTTAALCLAVTCVLFFFLFVLEDLSPATQTDQPDPPWGLLARYAVAMAAGGALAGLVSAGLFGRAGATGAILALIGGVVATLIAGALGSAMGLLPDMVAGGMQSQDLIAIAFGLFVVPLAIAEKPALAVVWVGLILATHLAVRAQRN